MLKRMSLSRDKLLSHHDNIVGIHERLLIAPELGLIRVVEGNHHISEVLTGDGLVLRASGTRDIDAQREVVVAVRLELFDFGIGHKTNHYADGSPTVNT